MTDKTYTLEAFPGDKPHRLAWPMARRMYIARAMTALNNTIDRTGIVFYLIDRKEFEGISLVKSKA